MREVVRTSVIPAAPKRLRASSLLPQASSESMLGLDLDYDHEMKVGGLTSMVTGLLFGPPVYQQVWACSRNHLGKHVACRVLCNGSGHVLR